MSEGLFREEALRHHSGMREAGDVLRLPPSWTRWTFHLLVGIAFAAAAYAALGTVPVSLHGLATAHVAYFPEEDRPRLAPGSPISLGAPGGTPPPRPGRIIAVDPASVPLAAALEELHEGAWPGPHAPSRLTRVEIETEGIEEGQVLSATVATGRSSLIGLLVPAARGSRGR